MRHTIFFHNIINRLKTDEVHGQFLRYAAIGITLNTALYLSYIALTHTFMNSLAAMTLTYCFGVLLGFVINRKITFGHQGNEASALLRYILSYLVGYIYNFIALLLLVDYAGYPHGAVQAGVRRNALGPVVRPSTLLGFSAFVAGAQWRYTERLRPWRFLLPQSSEI